MRVKLKFLDSVWDFIVNTGSTTAYTGPSTTNTATVTTNTESLTNTALSSQGNISETKLSGLPYIFLKDVMRHNFGEIRSSYSWTKSKQNFFTQTYCY